MSPKRHGGADAEAVALAIHELLRRVRFDDVQTVCRWGLTRTECHVLEIVAIDGPLTVNEVASRIRLNKSTASRAVQSLADKELLKRETDRDDRRAVSLATTRRGHALWRSIVDASVKIYGEILDGSTAAERKAVLRVLKRITDYATE
jgi:DNA-binding MarR family transcriptional regulator